MDRAYIAIDLKSFYASVECVERALDPLDTNLAVADGSRSEKTICLAVSPSLKSFGIPGRPRLFEVNERLRAVNRGNHKEKSISYKEIMSTGKAVGYITAPPRMALYIDYSTRIYDVYLRYIAPEDIHVYSIDEVFIDATDYLRIYRKSPEELARTMILDVLKTTGITAAAGIGTNLYLAKVAMDIMAKHAKADENGVRIASLDERSYREKLWSYRPLTDFWRVGHGYADKLEALRIFTMGDIARASIENEDILYRLFGVNAELLIDHAWGWECCTMKDIKAYRPESSSIGSGQVLQSPYSFEKARVVIREMADALSLDLISKDLAADQLTITVGYDAESLSIPGSAYKGEVKSDRYGRDIPKHAHGSISLGGFTSSPRRIISKASELYDRIADRSLLIRRMNITANHVMERAESYQRDLFEEESSALDRKEESFQRAALSIKKRYGKNAILRGIDYTEGATQRERNKQIGGHKA